MSANQYRHLNDNPMRDLFACMTVHEAARRFCVHPNTIRAAMDRGKLDFRKSDGTWLIGTESLIRYFGKPIEPPDMESVKFTLPLWRKIPNTVR